jgi:hypothetical protein
MTIQFSEEKILDQKVGIRSRTSEAYFFYFTYAQHCRSRVIYVMLGKAYCKERNHQTTIYILSSFCSEPCEKLWNV